MSTRLKTKTARLSVMSNTLLIIMKIAVGLVTNSVSILSEAIHSSLDLIEERFEREFRDKSVIIHPEPKN